MNHIELHKELSDTFKKLKSGKVDPKLAKEIFNGAGKIIANCKKELIAANLGIEIEIPLLEITKEESKKLANDKFKMLI